MRIDAHQHFWRVGRGDYGWLTPALAPLYRDFGPADLAPIIARHGIDKTVLVQAAPTLAETRFLIEIARETPFVAGVVGWTDFEAPDAPHTIAALAQEPALVALRPMVQDIADDDWLMRTDLVPAFEALIAHDLVFDALVLPRHLTRLAAILDNHPNLEVVVDHGAKPAIRDRCFEPWASDIARIAQAPQAACKLSGLVTEASANWSADDLRAYVDHLLAVFGPRRLIWGSDWPVVNLAGGYERWLEASEALLSALSADERAAVLGDNATLVYTGRGCIASREVPTSNGSESDSGHNPPP
jgi:L-fuconolactonase